MKMRNMEGSFANARTAVEYIVYDAPVMVMAVCAPSVVVTNQSRFKMNGSRTARTYLSGLFLSNKSLYLFKIAVYA